MSRTAVQSTVVKGDVLAAEGNGAKKSEVSVGKSNVSWTQAARGDVPDKAQAVHERVCKLLILSGLLSWAKDCTAQSQSKGLLLGLN